MRRPSPISLSRFFTTKPKGSGTGLGLATCYGIVKQNNGGIWVYSEPGMGTTFKVYLPAVFGDAGGVATTDQGSGAIPEGTETLLIAEDDVGIRSLLLSFLEKAGYRVFAASNGEEALSEVQKHDEPIHLLITDVVMPLMGGKELANRLTAMYPGLKVLFMSGYTDNSIVHHGVLDKGIMFIQKPFPMMEFMWKIRETLDAAGEGGG